MVAQRVQTLEETRQLGRQGLHVGVVVVAAAGGSLLAETQRRREAATRRRRSRARLQEHLTMQGGKRGVNVQKNLGERSEKHA